MPWPPTSGVTPGFSVQGVTTIRWGTDGLLQTPRVGANNYYTVLRFNEAALVDSNKLPNGTGITATRVLLLDGSQFTLTVRDDTRMTPPAVGGTIGIVDAGGLLGAVGLVYTCTVINPSYEAAPKQAGERTIVAERLILVEAGAGGAQA